MRKNGEKASDYARARAKQLRVDASFCGADKAAEMRAQAVRWLQMAAQLDHFTCDAAGLERLRTHVEGMQNGDRFDAALSRQMLAHAAESVLP